MRFKSLALAASLSLSAASPAALACDYENSSAQSEPTSKLELADCTGAQCVKPETERGSALASMTPTIHFKPVWKWMVNLAHRHPHIVTAAKACDGGCY